MLLFFAFLLGFSALAFGGTCWVKTILPLDDSNYMGVAQEGTTSGNGPRTPVISDGTATWTNIPAISLPILEFSPIGCTMRVGAGSCFGTAQPLPANPTVTLTTGCMVGAFVNIVNPDSSPTASSVSAGFSLGGSGPGSINTNGIITSGQGHASSGGQIAASGAYPASLFHTYNRDLAAPASYDAAIGVYGRADYDTPDPKEPIIRVSQLFAQCRSTLTCTDATDVQFISSSQYFLLQAGFSGVRRNFPELTITTQSIDSSSNTLTLGWTATGNIAPLEVSVDAGFDSSCVLCATVRYRRLSNSVTPSAALTDVCISQNHRIGDLASATYPSMCTKLIPDSPHATVVSIQNEPFPGLSFVPGVNYGLWMRAPAPGYVYDIYEMKSCSGFCTAPFLPGTE